MTDKNVLFSCSDWKRMIFSHISQNLVIILYYSLVKSSGLKLHISRRLLTPYLTESVSEKNLWQCLVQQNTAAERNSCKKPLLEDTAGSVELHIVGVTILSFSVQALYDLSFSLWPFHLIMNIKMYIVKIKGNSASHLLLQAIQLKDSQSAGDCRFQKDTFKTEHS